MDAITEALKALVQQWEQSRMTYLDLAKEKAGRALFAQADAMEARADECRLHAEALSAALSTPSAGLDATRPQDTYVSGEPMPQYAALGIGVDAWVDLTEQEKPRQDGRRLSDGVVLRRSTFDVVMRVLRAVRVKDFRESTPSAGWQPIPRCAVCGKPATCLGIYDHDDEARYACDGCCGHGGEDGRCMKLPAPPAGPAGDK